MTEQMVILGKNGRIVIPVTYRKRMGLSAGDKLVLRYEDGTIRIMTPRQAIRFAQSLVRRHVCKERSLADELIAERRLESGNE